MKRFLIILAVSVLVLAACLAVILIVANNRPIPSGDEGEYEYGFTEKGNDLLITVTGAFPEGYTWQPVGGNEGRVRVTEKKQNAKKAVFVVEPTRPGVSDVTLTLTRSDVLTDCRCAIKVSVYVGEDGKAVVAGSSHRDLPGLQTFGEGTAHPGCIASEPDGGMVVLVTGIGEGEWSCWQLRPGVVNSSAEKAEDGTYRFTLSADEEGQRELYLIDNATNDALLLSLSADGECVLHLNSIEQTTFDPSEHEEERRQAEVETTVGVIKLPAGAEMTKCNTKTLVGADGTTWSGAYIDFTHAGLAWRFLVIPGTAEGAIENYYAVDAASGSAVTVGGGDAVCYPVVETGSVDGVPYERHGTLVVWHTEGGYTFGVYAVDADGAAACAEAEALHAANPMDTAALPGVKSHE